MTERELLALRRLLTKFRAWDTSDYSMYGRKMDRALAEDLRVALPAYRPEE